MLLSIIVPVRNEIEYIKSTFNSIIQSTKGIECEIIFVDGQSSDGTFQWLKIEIEKFNNCSLIVNKNKYVSHAFNLVYPKTTGQYISRLDGHTVYPENYFNNAIKILRNTDNVSIIGGPAIHQGISWKGKTIANCMMSPFGVGGASFRTSTSKMYVDTVPFAVYKKRVFEELGLYNEKLIRNQDDEFNYRCRSKGYKILMHPDLKTEYYVRENLYDLVKQYFSYGLYKPDVFNLVPEGKRWYHFIPLLNLIHVPLCIYLANINIKFISPLLMYIAICIIESIRCQDNFKMILYSIFVFPCLHFSYGLGFLFGYLRKLRSKVVFLKKI